LLVNRRNRQIYFINNALPDDNDIQRRGAHA